MSDNRRNTARTRDGEAKTTMATSTPLLQAAVCGVETTGMVKMGRMQWQKGRRATMTKTMGQDDTNTDNEGQMTMTTTMMVGMPKFGSVWFFKDFAEPRTRLQVRSRKSAELWTGPSVQVQDSSVLGSGGSEPRTELFYTKNSLNGSRLCASTDMAQNSCIQATG